MRTLPDLTCPACARAAGLAELMAAHPPRAGHLALCSQCAAPLVFCEEGSALGLRVCEEADRAHLSPEMAGLLADVRAAVLRLRGLEVAA